MSEISEAIATTKILITIRNVEKLIFNIFSFSFSNIQTFWSWLPFLHKQLKQQI